MNLLKSALELVKENRGAYLTLNALYYGLVIAFMIIATFVPDVQAELLKSIGSAFTSGPLAYVGQAYINAEVVKAVLLTFVINLFIASLVYMTIPSLIIPFIGFLMFVLRAILWGLIFSPASPEMRLVMIPHSLTLLLEGQAYILVMFAVYLQGRAFLWPKSSGVEGFGRGYLEGLKRTGKVYSLVVLTLAVAAIYEVIEVILLAKFVG
jgi:hypothetical protein